MAFLHHQGLVVTLGWVRGWVRGSFRAFGRQCVARLMAWMGCRESMLPRCVCVCVCACLCILLLIWRHVSSSSYDIPHMTHAERVCCLDVCVCVCAYVSSSSYETCILLLMRVRHRVCMCFTCVWMCLKCCESLLKLKRQHFKQSQSLLKLKVYLLKKIKSTCKVYFNCTDL